MKQRAQLAGARCLVALALVASVALPAGASVAHVNVAEQKQELQSPFVLHAASIVEALQKQEQQKNQASHAAHVALQQEAPLHAASIVEALQKQEQQRNQTGNAAHVALQQEAKTMQPAAPVAQGPPPTYYRPFAKRFKSKEAKLDPDDEETENHEGYARFMEEHPRHPLVPNSIDRNAQSNVIFTFVIFAFAMVVGPLFIHYTLQDHKPEWQVLSMIGFFSIPLLLSMVWVMGIVLRFFSHPARRSVAGGHWQCNGMVWYLALFPIVTVLLFVSVVLYYVPKMLNMDPGAQMGRMTGSSQGADGKVGPTAHKAGNGVRGLLVTIGDLRFPGWLLGFLVFLEIALFLLGICLTYLLDYNSHFCEPEVWYTTAVLVTVTVMITGILCLTLCCQQAAVAVSNSKFVRDFMRSFDDSWHAAEMAPAPPMAPVASRPGQPYSKREVTWEPQAQKQPLAVPSTLQPSYANAGYPPRSAAPNFAGVPNQPMVPALPSRAVVDCAPPQMYPPAFPPRSQSYPGPMQSYQVPPNAPMKWPSAGFAAPFALPPGQGPAPFAEAQGFPVGSRVEARYHDGGDQYHAGQVVGRNPSGTHQVAYDDGDHWDDVPANYMRAGA